MWETIGSWLAIPYTWMIPHDLAWQVWVDAHVEELWPMWMEQTMYGDNPLAKIAGI